MKAKLDKVVVQAYFIVMDDEGDIIVPSRPLQPAEIPGKQFKNGWTMDTDKLGEEVLRALNLPADPPNSSTDNVTHISNGHSHDDLEAVTIGE